MDKKKWIQPKAEVQAFIPNEYVAACAICDVNYMPGDYYVDDNKDGKYNQSDDRTWAPYGNIPPACGMPVGPEKKVWIADGKTLPIRHKDTNVRVYLWSDGNFNYHLSTGSTNSAS